MCTECGRELCSDCYAALGEYHVAPEWREIAKRRPDLLTPEEMVKRNYLHCQMSDPHCQSNFIPVSRFDLDELDTVVKEMEAAIQPPYPIQLSAKEILLLAPQFDMAVIASTSTANVASAHSEPESPMAALPNPPFPQRSSQPVSSIFHPPTDPAQIPHQPFQTFADTDLTEEIFRSKWSNGETMVVTGLLKKFSHDWSPKYFIKTYGTEECEIVDCATQDVEVTKVGAFFQMFGDYSARRKILKLKVWCFLTVCLSCPNIVSVQDWPPQADFKEAFPELFADFHQAVPIPNYTRRDGSMNIAAHFPTNAVAPDIGVFHSFRYIFLSVPVLMVLRGIF
jgi:lysine-specific demethylase 3